MKRILIVFVALFTMMSAFGQTSEEVIAAFKNSYEQEKKGEYTEAIATIKKVYLEQSYEQNLRLGWLHYLAGLFIESTAYYQKASDLMPYSIEARLGLANPASALGNWDSVIKRYEEVLKIDPNNTTANYRLGLICYNRADFEKAYSYFEKVINLYPFDYDTNLMFAWTNYKLGKLREAKILFNKVLMYSPGDESATEGLGLIK